VRSELVQQLATLLDGVELVATPRLGRELRRVKTAGEIETLKAAAACVGAGMEACFQAVRVGATDREAAAAATAAARRYGADSILFVQVKAGPRGAYPDAEEVGRPFQADEIGFIDLGVRHRLYFADYARAFVIGEPPAEAWRIVEVVDHLQRAALTMLRPGLRCRDFYHAVRQMFADEGYPDAIPHHLGHGVGIWDDVIPDIVPTSDDAFVAGEVVCVEPGVYVRGVGGARIEDTVVVRSGGNEVISLAPRIGRCLT
jgi:Xaa-Pro aminopeptidase